MNEDQQRWLAERQQKFIDRVENASFALWNSLLTVNGIVATVFSAVALLDKGFESLVAIGVVIFCIISSILIIWNFKVIRDHHWRVASTTDADFAKTSPQEKEQCFRDSRRMRVWVKKRELCARWLMFLAALLIVALLITHRVQGALSHGSSACSANLLSLIASTFD